MGSNHGVRSIHIAPKNHGVRSKTTGSGLYKLHRKTNGFVSRYSLLVSCFHPPFKIIRRITPFSPKQNRVINQVAVRCPRTAVDGVAADPGLDEVVAAARVEPVGAVGQRVGTVSGSPVDGVVAHADAREPRTTGSGLYILHRKTNGDVARYPVLVSCFHPPFKIIRRYANRQQFLTPNYFVHTM